jgi:hypothetical protein
MTDDYDPLADEEAEAAAAEARNIGGRPTRDLEEDLPHDPAMDPVYEAGGGESEGWEMAEEELIEHSEHGPARAEVEVHVREEEYVEESEPNRSLYGEPDEEDVTEVLYDPEEGPDDPEAGTPLAPDR